MSANLLYRPSLRGAVGALVAAACAATPLAAQPTGREPPEIGYAYPAGGRAGTTLVVTIGGQHLNDTSLATFAGGGVTAKVLQHERPPTQKEQEEIKSQLDQLRAKRQ